MDINAIASAAAKGAASSTRDKAQTAQILRDLMEQDTERGAEYWAPAYRYLLAAMKPATGKAGKNDAAWAHLAVGVNDIRYYLNWAYSDGKRLMATDGHRLHIATGITRPAGWYDKGGQRLALADEEGWEYPDVDRIIPRLSDCAAYAAVLSELESGEIPGISRKGKKLLAVKLPCGRWIDRRYLVDALAGHPAGNNGAFTYHAAPDRTDTAIRIDYGNRLAVIMPCRM